MELPSLSRTDASSVPTHVAHARAGAEHADDAGAERARDAARGFSSLLATMIVKELRRALPDGPFGAGTAGEVYAGWFDEHVGRALADGGALQLDERLAAELARAPARDALQAEAAVPSLPVQAREVRS